MLVLCKFSFVKVIIHYIIQLFASDFRLYIFAQLNWTIWHRFFFSTKSISTLVFWRCPVPAHSSFAPAKVTQGHCLLMDSGLLCPFCLCHLIHCFKVKEMMWSIRTDARSTKPSENVFVQFPSATHMHASGNKLTSDTMPLCCVPLTEIELRTISSHK